MDQFFKIRNLFVLSIAATFIWSGAAWADPLSYKNYVRIGAGINQPTDDLEDGDWDAGPSASVTYGRYLMRHLVVEGTTSYFYTDREVQGATARAGSYTREDRVNAMAILGTIKGELPIKSLTLFAGAGVGYYLVGLDSDVETELIGEFDEQDSDGAFGAHIVAGAYYNIHRRVFIGIEGLYRWTEDVDIRENVGSVPIRLDGNLNGYSISLTGGFRF